jgi:hypothetical protein
MVLKSFINGGTTIFGIIFKCQLFDWVEGMLNLDLLTTKFGMLQGYDYTILTMDNSSNTGGGNSIPKVNLNFYNPATHTHVHPPAANYLDVSDNGLNAVQVSAVTTVSLTALKNVASLPPVPKAVATIGIMATTAAVVAHNEITSRDYKNLVENNRHEEAMADKRTPSPKSGWWGVYTRRCRA